MLSGIVTAILLTAFLGGAYWLFGMHRASDFDAAAQLPLEDSTKDDQP